MPFSTSLYTQLATAPKTITPASQIQSSQLGNLTIHPLERLNSEIEFIYRKSVALRLSGDNHGSQNIIRDFLSSLGPRDLSSNENLAALYISQATNHSYHFSFTEAHGELKKWTPDKNLPGRQKQLLWDQMLCIGRVVRGQGCFEAARTCFEQCLITPGISQSRRFLVKSSLADLFCELDYTTKSEKTPYLQQAAHLVEPDVQQFRSTSNHHQRGYRRLLLSLCEIKIIEHQYCDAESLVEELLDIYAKVHEPDIVDRLGHVRSLIAFARISPTPIIAIKRWKDVLAWNRRYNPGEEEVFTCGVVYLFLCLTWHSLGYMAESTENLQMAIKVLREKRPQFLIPGIGTYLFYDVNYQLRRLVDKGYLQLSDNLRSYLRKVDTTYK